MTIEPTDILSLTLELPAAVRLITYNNAPAILDPRIVSFDFLDRLIGARDVLVDMSAWPALPVQMRQREYLRGHRVVVASAGPRGFVYRETEEWSRISGRVQVVPPIEDAHDLRSVITFMRQLRDSHQGVAVIGGTVLTAAAEWVADRAVIITPDIPNVPAHSIYGHALPMPARFDLEHAESNLPIYTGGPDVMVEYFKAV